MRIFVCCISSAARTCILYFFHSTNQRYSKWLSNLHHMNEMLELFTSTFLCSASPNKWVLQRMHNAVCVSCFLWICVRARLFSIVHAHKFYFTDDNAIFFSFSFRWCFFFRVACASDSNEHIETTAIANTTCNRFGRI